MPQGLVARFDATRFDCSNCFFYPSSLGYLGDWSLLRSPHASLRCFDTSCFDPTRFDPSMLLLRSLVTSIITWIARLALSFVAWELGRLDTSIYSLRYSLRHSLGYSMLRCFDASTLRYFDTSIFRYFDTSILRYFDTSLECFATRFDACLNASRLRCSLRCYSRRSLECRFDTSMPRFDTCFDPGFHARFDNRSEVGVGSRRHSMLDSHACFDHWSLR
jgi:hypothetical protein